MLFKKIAFLLLLFVPAAFAQVKEQIEAYD